MGSLSFMTGPIETLPFAVCTVYPDIFKTHPWIYYTILYVLICIYFMYMYMYMYNICVYIYTYIYIYTVHILHIHLLGMNIQKSKPILVFLKGTLQQVQQRWLRLSRRSGDPKFPSRNQHQVLMLWKKNGISMTISNCGITVVSIHVECRIHQVLYTSIVYTCLYMIYLNNAHSPECLNQQGHTVK